MRLIDFCHPSLDCEHSRLVGSWCFARILRCASRRRSQLPFWENQRSTRQAQGSRRFTTPRTLRRTVRHGIGLHSALSSLSRARGRFLPAACRTIEPLTPLSRPVTLLEWWSTFVIPPRSVAKRQDRVSPIPVKGTGRDGPRCLPPASALHGPSSDHDSGSYLPLRTDSRRSFTCGPPSRLSDTPGSARAEIPGHPRGPFRFREAPATASRDQTSPADFCNTTRPASTTSNCMTLARIGWRLFRSLRVCHVATAIPLSE